MNGSRKEQRMRLVADKWAKFAVLKQSKDVAGYIPEMRRYSGAAMRVMLRRYGFVVAKPFIGTGGIGVVKIERLSKNRYRFHHARKQVVVRSMQKLMHKVKRLKTKRKYLIQQGIRLAMISGRPVDYRVKMVKKGRKWRITAVVARIARKGQFVTNLCRGGEMRNGFLALIQSFPPEEASIKKESMRQIARKSTRMLERRYPGIASLGYDFGIDRRGRIWIFEVNTRPH